MTSDRKVAKLVEVVEAVALEPCELSTSVGDSESTCPRVFPGNPDDWCRPCLARRALAEYLEGLKDQRRTDCIRLLAEIDQGIAECESLILDDDLDEEDREYMWRQLAFRHKVVERVEQMLADTEGG